MTFALPSSVLRRLAKETAALRQDPPEGIRIIVNEDDISDINAWVAGPLGTPYAGGYFKIKFTFPVEYPAAPPKCVFLTKIFHPNVGPSGDVCVSTLKKDWSSRCTLSHILIVIKCLLIHPNPESALDEEAGRLLLEQYGEYAARAKLLTTIHAGSNKPKPVEFAQEFVSECEARHVAKSVGCADKSTLVIPPVPATAPLQETNSVQNSACSPVSLIGSLNKKRSVASALGECCNSVIGNLGQAETRKEVRGTPQSTNYVANNATKKRGLRRL